MADHVRKQIRDALVDAITPVSSVFPGTKVGANVYRSRAIPLATIKTPAILVYARSETVIYEDSAAMGTAAIPERIIDARFQIYVKDDDDDEADEIAKQVEELLYASSALDALITELKVGDTEMDIEADAERALLVADAGFFVHYRAAEGTPDAAV